MAIDELLMSENKMRFELKERGGVEVPAPY